MATEEPSLNRMNTPAPRRVFFLDYLRILAFISVLAGHKFINFAGSFINDPSVHATPKYIVGLLMPILVGGGFGVVLFFLVSGYIITHVLQTETSSEFMVKRIFRIYPLYWVAVLLQWFFWYPDGSRPSISILIQQMSLMGDFFSTPLALKGVEWTLRVEVMFYLLMASLKVLGAFRGPKLLLPITLSLIVPFLALAPLPYVPNQWYHGYLSIYFPFLVLGALFYLTEIKKCGMTFLIAMGIWILLQYYSQIALIQPAWLGAHFATLACLTFAIAFSLRHAISAPAWVLWFSNLTYATYLTHNWMFEMLATPLTWLGLTPFYLACAITLVLLGICYGLHLLVERNGIRLGKIVSGKIAKTSHADLAANGNAPMTDAKTIIPRFMLPCLLIGIYAYAMIHYVKVSVENMIFTDQYRIVARQVIPWISGEGWKMSLLWESHAGHRGVFYYLLCILNASLFSYNTIFESILSVVFTGMVLFIMCNRSLDLNGLVARRRIDIPTVAISLAILSVVLALACSGLFAWTIGVYIFAKNFALVAMIYMIAKVIEKESIGKPAIIAVGVVHLIASLIFFGGYMYAFLLSVTLSLTACVLPATRSRSTIQLYISILVSSILAVALYSYGLDNSGVSLHEHIQVMQLAKFILICFGNSLVLNSPFLLDTFGSRGCALAGVIILIPMLWALIRSAQSARKSFMPLALISYSIICVSMISVARVSHFSAEYALQPRYIPETAIGLLGMIMYFANSIPKTRPSYRLLTIAGFTIISCFSLTGYWRELNIGPYRKYNIRANEGLAQRLLFSPNEMTGKDFTSFNAASKEEVILAVELCAKYELSSFSEGKGYGNKEYFTGDWYYPEKDGIWLKGEASLAYAATDRDVIEFDATAPRTESRTAMIGINGKTVFNGTIKPDETIHIHEVVQKCNWIKIAFHVSNPSIIAGTGDQRSLGLKIHVPMNRTCVRVTLPKEGDLSSLETMPLP